MTLRTSHGNVNTLAQLKQVLSLGIFYRNANLEMFEPFLKVNIFMIILNFMGTL